jgi:hypothetical protein
VDIEKFLINELIRFLKDHNYEIPAELLAKRSVILIDDEKETHDFFREIFKKLKALI